MVPVDGLTLPALGNDASAIFPLDGNLSDPHFPAMTIENEIAGRKALAEKLRVAVGLRSAHASQLASGDKSPSLDLALRIEEATGIPPFFWKSENRGAAMWARIEQGMKK